MTFGEFVATKRKERKLTQKDLAAKILKEDGNAITAQYLNDIEHDRRNPPAGQLLEQFAKMLDIPVDALYVLAGKMPDNLLKSKDVDVQKLEVAFQAFRKKLKE
jgi:transcriptional regulator with XRE-family HTH domain